MSLDNKEALNEKAIIVIIILMILLSIGCDGDPTDSPYDKSVTTYSVFVLGNDVYVTGHWYQPEVTDKNVECYWKNNIRIDRSIKEDLDDIMAHYDYKENFLFRKGGYYSS